MRRLLVCLVLFGAPLPAQSLLYRSPNLSGTWVGEPGVVQFNFLHRFYVTPSGPNSPHTVINYPTFTLAVGLPQHLALGMRYATRSSAVVGSIIVLISDILFAGKPPCCACARIMSSLGAM